MNISQSKISKQIFFCVRSFRFFAVSFLLLFGSVAVCMEELENKNNNPSHDCAAPELPDCVHPLWAFKDAVGYTLSTKNLIAPFFTGPVYSNVPHVYADSPLGHLSADAALMKKLVAAAEKNEDGIASCWLGPVAITYVVLNKTRLEVVKEHILGIIDANAHQRLQRLFLGNNVMCTFPDFRPIDSPTYQAQRKFLQTRFYGQTSDLLPLVQTVVKNFLVKHANGYKNTPLSLREFITRLVLHSSSHLLGLSKFPLDSEYFIQRGVLDLVSSVARYGISKDFDKDFESKLNILFQEILRANFDQIKRETSRENLIRNIFESMNVDFPKNLNDIDTISPEVFHEIAMNFASTGLGAMVHSTTSTLDWAVARLLSHDAGDDLLALKALVRSQRHIDLSKPEHYNKNGALFLLSEWVMHNVFLYPAFREQFFLNTQDYPVTLPNCDKQMVIPRNTFVVVNYQECNRGQESLKGSQAFCNSLANENTVSSFILDKRNAAFGGSARGKTRKCPGAKIALYEQMISIALILQDYDLELSPNAPLSLAVDDSMYPLLARSALGDVRLKPLSPLPGGH